MQAHTEPDEAPSPPIDPAELHPVIAALSRPRMTGTAGAAHVAAEIRRRFRDLGYQTRALPFSFSTIPGRYGLPVAGVALVATGVAAARLLSAGQAGLALAVLAVGLALATLPLALLGQALQRFPWGRVETANLLFTRARPRWIVMAHLDTKSQLAPTLVRTAALATAVLAWLAMAGAALVAVAGGADARPHGLAWAAGAALAVAGGVLGLSRSGNRSPGALDNATGLAALLALAERAGTDTGFLVTDGEEMGLAGARAAAGLLPAVEGIINLDGLDDPGPIRIAESRAGPGRGTGGEVAAKLLETARARGVPAVRRQLPPFVLVDHEPLAAAGLPAMTLLKGRPSSLLRVHRPGDSPDRLTGRGAAEVATVVLAALSALARDPDTLRPDERSGHSPAL